MTALLPGTQVGARGLAWEIVQVEPAGAQKRFRLRCIQGDLRGTELDLLHPLEGITPVSTELDPKRAGRLRQWLLYHQAFLLEQALGPTALLAVQPGRLDIAPYQLVPVMRAIRMSRPRLLLADGVGLGKTVQAGLVMAELIARRRAHRILIVSPAGPLLNQWHREMRTRFGLRFTTIKDAGELREARRGLVLGANPFDHVSFCLTSVDFAKQEKILQDLERTSWDLVVIDEAHHCVRMGRAGDWEDSRRRRLAELLARQADGLLLLTATPHDGYDPHFASLVELLDPSLVDGRGSLRGEQYRGHVVRRLKQHVKDPETGEDLFKIREVEPRPVLFDEQSHPHFARFQRALLGLVAPRLRKAVRQRRYGDVLAFVSLLKRSVSTAVACGNTIEKILSRYTEMVEKGREQKESRKQRLRTLRDYRRRLERYGALSFEEEQDQAELEAEEMAAELLGTAPDELTESIDTLQRKQRRERDRIRRVDTTREALAELLELARGASSEDPKLTAVLQEIQTIRAAEPRANILVYTEYTDSQDEVVHYLRGAAGQGRLSGEIIATSGRPEHKKEREEVTERFGCDDDLILVSTDATAEGLNLHERCHHLVHVELPYNPNRLEQRNGRIDRYGQRHTPRVSYLYLAGTFEERLLMRLVAKYERQRSRLTFVPNTLGGITTQEASTVRLLEGLAAEEQSLFKRPAREIQMVEEEPDDTDSAAYRELLAEVERAMTGFEKAAKTNVWLAEQGLNAEAHLVEEARRAREVGGQLGGVELLDFVCAAIEDESPSGQAVSRHGNGTVELDVPPSWTFGLDGLPGFDPDARRLLVTTDKDQTRDEAGRPVGYLGRAHPIVRRALDRVRSIRFGEAGAYLERRVSAVAWDGEAPAMLLTFLCQVESGNGREYERLVAVQVDRRETIEVLTEPARWLAMADRGRQLATKGLWERTFDGWALDRQDDAQREAGDAFASLAEPFVNRHRDEVDSERRALDGWLRERTEALCGPVTSVQATLFDDGMDDLPRWRTLSDPIERLAAFATDGANKPAQRREADGVLRLYRQRSSDLDRRAEIRVHEPTLLGLLMLVPGKGGG